ncbi:MAG: hypothetical protein HYT79_08845 [Elusimicrobia bacterium]|nr:hypothetical protein [Elusimicrobiota bacterium]
MNKKPAALIVSMILTTGFAVAEHPTEHPTGQTHEHPASHESHEHPEGHEHPAGSTGWKKQMYGEYNDFVKTHVKTKSAKGSFKIKDAKLNKEWRLKLVRIHTNKIVHLGGDSFFACADFKSALKGDKNTVDLDFYATKTESGWIMDKVVIHKVNGKPRFTYNSNNKMVPLQEKK